VRSSKTGTHCVALRNSGSDRSYVAEYTVGAANTWEFKTITVADGFVSAGTWNFTNGAGVIVEWALAVGSTLQTTPGAWQTGTFIGTSNQVNCLDTIGNIFAITGVQLEAGSVATPFERRDYGRELIMCQRYYYRVSPDLNAPFGAGFNVSTTQAYINASFPTVMRITPTAVEQTGTASNYRVRHSGGGTACSSVVSFVNGSPSNSFVIFTVASGLTAGQGSFGETNATGAYLAWSAEL
jgi:hypothetical protein